MKSASAKAIEKCGFYNPRLKPGLVNKIHAALAKERYTVGKLNRNFKVQVSDTTMLNKVIMLVTK